MIRISTIFIAICMVLVAASLGLVLHSVAGISGSESAIVALTALTFLILYNAVSMRLRDRSDVGNQIADLSRGTADLAPPGRRIRPPARRGRGPGGVGKLHRRRPHPVRGRRDQRTRRAGETARRLRRPSRRRAVLGRDRCCPCPCPCPCPRRQRGRRTADRIAAQQGRSAGRARRKTRGGCTAGISAGCRDRRLAVPQPAAIAGGDQERGRGKTGSTSICSRW
jgi:hypothetical protein